VPHLEDEFLTFVTPLPPLLILSLKTVIVLGTLTSLKPPSLAFFCCDLTM